MILSILSGLLVWTFLKKKSSQSQIQKDTIFKLIVIPIGIISFVSTFLIIGYYQISNFRCNYYVPLSFPLEITHCNDEMPTLPTVMHFYFKIFGFKISLFEIAIYSMWQVIGVLLLLGLILFILNYSITRLVLFGFEKNFSEG